MGCMGAGAHHYLTRHHRVDWISSLLEHNASKWPSTSEPAGLTVQREIVKTAQPVDDSTDRVHALGRPRRLAFIDVYPPGRLNWADTDPRQTLAGGKVAHLFQDHLLKFRGCPFLSHRRAQSFGASSGEWSHLTGTFVAGVRSRRDGGLCGLDTSIPAFGQKFPECPVCPVLGSTRRSSAFVGVSAKFFHR